MRARTFTIAACLVLPRPALAEEENKPPTYDESALKAALEEKPGARKTHEKAGEALEVPPPPPRKSGVVVEGSIGAMGFLGKLKNISPTASTFHLQLGFEPFRWFMVFGEGDLSFTSTRYSPPSRGYFYDAENLNGYFGATGGLEWYQADPHYALAVYGGIRSQQGFLRAVPGDNPLAWRGAVAIRYAF